MNQVRLTDEEIQKLIECIQAGAEVPEDLLPKLSPEFFEKLRAAGKFDYKELDKYKIPVLEYAGKRSESVILAQAAITGGAAPLQVVRNFGKSSKDEWRNMIVQGDNLQFLKTCYMNHDPLIKDKVKGQVKLIYIDPPFATKGDFSSSEGFQSYSDKVDRSEFIESLRERLIYLRELLSSKGTFYIHLDQKMVHYMRVCLDEVFGSGNFAGHITWYYPNKIPDARKKKFTVSSDHILAYTKNQGEQTFIPQYFSVTPHKRAKEIKVNGVKKSVRDENGNVVYDVYDKRLRDNVWNIASLAGSSKEKHEIDFPTQKPEKLLQVIISASTEEDDIVLDCFAGSGTVAAVAEKLKRRWIVCEFGKHAIYTMQKRIINISNSNDLNGNDNKKEKYGKSPRPFDIISAGAYDFSKIMNLRENKDIYITFVLGLFNIIQEKIDFSKKFKLPNIFAEKEGDPVEVYPIWEDEYLKEIRIDEEYLQGIINASGGKLKGDYYIITPETCTIVGNMKMKNSQKEDITFQMLKFPYKVLEDISRQFQIEEQPSSSADINKLISSTGFYFNEEVSIKVKKEKSGIEIEDFSTMILNSKKELFKGLDGLSMILLDNNYDGKVFNMDQAIYAKDIAEDGLVKASGISDKSAIIAIDKHGNESKIIRI